MARLYAPENSPEQNLAILTAHEYPGRFFVMGFADDVAVQAYAIMGRSEPSRNRILVEKDGVVSTEMFDTSQPVGNPELTIYDAMTREGTNHIVSNGRQTTTIADYLRGGRTFEEAMDTHTYEPDPPNNTSRISGVLNTDAGEGEPPMSISVVRKVWVSSIPVRNFFRVSDCKTPLASGVGLGVHTYKENRPPGEPLPTYDEVPFRMPIEDTAQGMAELVWKALNEENRVAVAAKVITPTAQEIVIINRYR